MRAYWIRITVALGCGLALGACAAQPDGPSGAAGTVESALTCGAADLVKPAGAACDGPWEYRLYVHQCTVQCTRPRECRHPCFGDSGARETRSASFGESGTCYYVHTCEDYIPPRCFWELDRQVPS